MALFMGLIESVYDWWECIVGIIGIDRMIINIYKPDDWEDQIQCCWKSAQDEKCNQLGYQGEMPRNIGKWVGIVQGWKGVYIETI